MNGSPSTLANRPPGRRSPAFRLCRILVAVAIALTIVPPPARAAAPNAPTITLLRPESGKIWLSWSNPTNATGNHISTDGGDTVLGGDITNTLGRWIYDLTNGQDYVIAVRAYNADGNSAWVTREAYPTAGPIAPDVNGIATLTAVAGHRRMTLSWEKHDNSAITKYQYSVDSVGYNDFTDIPGSGSGTTEYTVVSDNNGNGLNNDTTYKFAIRAVDTNGGGAPSTKSAAPKLTPPPKPTAFYVGGNDEFIAMKWSAPTSDLPLPPVTGYKVGIKVASSNGGLSWGSTSGRVQHSFFNLTNNIEYTVGVRAYNDAGDGDPVTGTATPKAPQMLSVLTYSPSPATYGGTAPTLTATPVVTVPATGGGAVTYTASPASVCSVNSGNGALTINGAGSCTIRATAAATDDYTSGVVSFNLTVDQASQTLTGFAYSPATVTFGGTAPTLTAPSGAQGTLSYASSDTSVCSVDEDTGVLGIEGAGSCTITAAAAATDDGNYQATSVTFELTVDQASQTLTGFAYSPATVTFGGTAPTLTAPSGAQGTLSYASSDTSVCSVDEDTGVLGIEGAGSCTITAAAAATDDYTSGVVSFNLTVDQATLTGFAYRSVTFGGNADGGPGVPDADGLCLHRRRQLRRPSPSAARRRR